MPEPLFGTRPSRAIFDDDEEERRRRGRLGNGVAADLQTDAPETETLETDTADPASQGAGDSFAPEPGARSPVFKRSRPDDPFAPRPDAGAPALSSADAQGLLAPDGLERAQTLAQEHGAALPKAAGMAIKSREARAESGMLAALATDPRAFLDVHSTVSQPPFFADRGLVQAPTRQVMGLVSQDMARLGIPESRTLAELGARRIQHLVAQGLPLDQARDHFYTRVLSPNAQALAEAFVDADNDGIPDTLERSAARRAEARIDAAKDAEAARTSEIEVSPGDDEMAVEASREMRQSPAPDRETAVAEGEESGQAGSPVQPAIRGDDTRRVAAPETESDRENGDDARQVEEDRPAETGDDERTAESDPSEGPAGASDDAAGPSDMQGTPLSQDPGAIYLRSLDPSKQRELILDIARSSEHMSDADLDRVSPLQDLRPAAVRALRAGFFVDDAESLADFEDLVRAGFQGNAQSRLLALAPRLVGADEETRRRILKNGARDALTWVKPDSVGTGRIHTALGDSADDLVALDNRALGEEILSWFGFEEPNETAALLLGGAVDFVGLASAKDAAGSLIRAFDAMSRGEMGSGMIYLAAAAANGADAASSLSGGVLKWLFKKTVKKEALTGAASAVGRWVDRIDLSGADMVTTIFAETFRAERDVSPPLPALGKALAAGLIAGALHSGVNAPGMIAVAKRIDAKKLKDATDLPAPLKAVVAQVTNLSDFLDDGLTTEALAAMFVDVGRMVETQLEAEELVPRGR